MSPGVVTPDVRATDAAVEILGLGGTAADAAISATAVLGVVQPHTCGLGGDVVAIVDSVGSSMPMVVLGIGRSGANANSQLLRDQGLDEIPRTHPAAITIPGALDGWLRLHEQYGRLPLEGVLSSAISLAEKGFDINQELASELTKTPWHDGTGPPEGVRGNAEDRPGLWKRPSLARLLRRIASEGRSAFYAGEVADDILSVTEGLVTEEDLLVNQAKLATPLTVSGQDLTLLIPGPPTQGALLAQSFSIMDELAGWDIPADGLALHLLIESYRLAAEDSVSRSLALDPVEVGGNVSGISMHHAGYRTPLVGVLGGTAYLATSDSEGNLVSMSQSNYYRMGSGRIAASVGLPLNNRGGGFTLDKGHVNELRPNSRPFHTLIPTIVRHPDGAVTGIGTRGGLLQPQILLQLLFWSLRRGGYPGAHIDLPRFNVRPELASSLVFVESLFPGDLANELTLRGHRLVMRGKSEPSWGPAFALTLDSHDAVSAAVDPRSDGKAWSGGGISSSSPRVNTT